MTKIARFIIWICSKFTKSEIEQIIKGLVDVLRDRNPEVKPKDDFKEKHPLYRDFFVDPKPPLTEPSVLKKASEPKSLPTHLEDEPMLFTSINAVGRAALKFIIATRL